MKIEGTNCFNCRFVDRKDIMIGDELNGEGGIDPKDDSEMDRAERADLITLPGGTGDDAKSKRMCMHPEVRMYVTERMCCAYWDNEDVKRPWIGKEKKAPAGYA